MPVDVAALIDTMLEERQFETVANDVRAQFGTPAKRYLGATLLPEQPKDENFYEESGIRYRSIIANDGTKYNPVQIKSGILVGSFEVRLGFQDTGSHFTAKDYDVFQRLLKQADNVKSAPAMQAMRSVLRWNDTQLNIPMREKIEKSRWQAIVDAVVIRQGDNGYYEEVFLSNPQYHRVASGDWSDPNYDPIDDIQERVQLLKDKGYTVNRIITSTSVRNMLLAHPKVAQRLGGLAILNGTVIIGLKPLVNIDDLNSYLGKNELPSIEVYDLQYQTDTGSEFFLKRNVMVFVATTGRDEELYLGPDGAPVVIQNTLGYAAIGTPTGENSPKRVVKVEFFDRKPPRLEGEIWQASFPVLAEPEAVAVLTDIPIPAGRLI